MALPEPYEAHCHRPSHRPHTPSWPTPAQTRQNPAAEPVTATSASGRRCKHTLDYQHACDRWHTSNAKKPPGRSSRAEQSRTLEREAMPSAPPSDNASCGSCLQPLPLRSPQRTHRQLPGQLPGAPHVVEAADVGHRHIHTRLHNDATCGSKAG